MKKVVLILVYGIPSAVPKGWLISFKDVQKQINKVFASTKQEVKFCFIDSLLVDGSICFSSNGERDSSNKGGVNLLLRTIEVQIIILEKLDELGVKHGEVTFLAGSGSTNVGYSAEEISEAKSNTNVIAK